jgi:gamma-glutamyl-gamma-aminobutyrate hydrolase PuuD
MKKTSSHRSTAELKQLIRQHYQALQVQWHLELESETKTDWTALFEIHYRITEMERRAPWLKKEVA